MDSISGASVGTFVALLLLLVVAFWLLRIPVKIARHRGMSERDIHMISILCWVGVLLGVTWIAALVWAIIGEKECAVLTQGIEANHPKEDIVNSIEKLCDLKNKGAITEEEFREKKEQLLKQL